MDIKKNLARPFVLALAIHLTLIGLFALSALYKPAPKEQPPAPEIIHATMIDLATLPTKVEKDNTEEASPVNTEAEVETQAKADAAKEAKAEAAAQAKADAAKEAKAEAAAQAKAEAAKQAKAEAAAQAKADAAKAKAEADAAEASKNKLAAQASESNQAKLAIQKKVERSWIRPATVNEGLKCIIKVKLMSDGTVISAEVMSSSGDEIFDRSAENAVEKASPLPVPNDKELFAQEFRSFQFLFNPK